MALSAPGIGSNLDISGIVSQLMAAEQRPLQNLKKQESSFQAKLSALGNLKSALSTFQGAVKALADTSKFQAVQAKADTTIASVTAAAGATPGNYALEVTKLAQAQKLAAAGQAATSTAIGNGTVTIDFGAISGGTFDAASGKYTGASFTSSGAGAKSLVIDPTNNTLAGIRDAINGAKMGVTASIVNDGGTSPYRLTLTQTATGKTSSMKISVSGDPALAALLSHDPGSASANQAFSETATAQNAEFKLDGIAITKPTNTVSDAIEGVTLNLVKTNSGNPTSVSVTRDTSAVTGAVGQFVFAYNQISATLSELSSYNAATKQGAVLNGDSTIRSIQTQLRGVLTAPVTGGAGTANTYTLLSEVGVTFQKDGKLAVDNTKLQAAMDKNFSAVAGVFAAVGKPTDSLVAYSGASAKTAPGSYAVNVTRLASQASTTGSTPAAGPTQGDTTGSAAAGLTITAGSNDTLSVELDGTTQVITLAAGAYANAAALVTEVQTKINAAFTAQVTVSESGGVLKITSNSTGPSSTVSITGGNGKTNLLGASPTTTAGSETSITAGVNDTVEVQLDGVTATVTLAAGRYSYSSLAAEVQSKINGASGFVTAGSSVAVTQSAGVMKITSNRFGSASSVNIAGGNGKTNLVGAGSTAGVGQDVAGTINGVAAVGSGHFLTGAKDTAAEGLKLQISGGATGARGTVSYSQGYAFQFNKLAETLLGKDGPISSRTDGIAVSLKNLDQAKQRISDRLIDIERRYRAQFTALDVAMSNMSKTSSYLQQQLASLPGMG